MLHSDEICFYATQAGCFLLKPLLLYCLPAYQVLIRVYGLDSQAKARGYRPMIRDGRLVTFVIEAFNAAVVPAAV